MKNDITYRWAGTPSCPVVEAVAPEGFVIASYRNRNEAEKKALSALQKLRSGRKEASVLSTRGMVPKDKLLILRSRLEALEAQLQNSSADNIITLTSEIRSTRHRIAAIESRDPSFSNQS